MPHITLTATTSRLHNPSHPHITATATATATSIPDNGGNGHDTLQNWSSIIGIVTAIVGNILIALALNVQRYAHIRLQRKRAYVRQRARAALKRAQSGQQYGDGSAVGPYGGGDSDGYMRSESSAPDADEAGEREPLNGSGHSSEATARRSEEQDNEDGEDEATDTYLKSPYWWLGQILITLGEMGNFLAYGFAPASIVSPLGVVALISNCIIAPAMFQEKFRARDFWGVVIAVGGVVTVVLSAKQEETKLDPHAVWDAITTLAFEVYLAVTVTLILVLMWASPKYGRKTILIDLGLVGLFGGYTALATKGVSSMLSSTFWRAFTTPVTYVLIVVLLGTAIMQIRYVNKALQRFESTQVIPIQFVMFTLCVILGSAILYRDFERTTTEQAAKFVGGCLLTFFGVFLITSGRNSKEEDDEDDMLDEHDHDDEVFGLARQDSGAGDARGQSQSRRSSRVSRISFGSTIKPDTIQHDVDVPSIRHPESTPSGSYVDESAPLLTQTWSAPQNSNAPPRGIRTLSADSVMLLSAASPPLSGATSPRPSTKDGLSAAGYGSARPTTARMGQTPSKTWHGMRRGTFISPSPFSSTVTAVVKDAFLRPGPGHLARKSSMRRLQTSIRASLFFHGDNDDEEDDNIAHYKTASQPQLSLAMTPPLGDARPSTSYPFPSGDTNGEASSHNNDNTNDPDNTAQQQGGRSRSMSDTLGDFFRPTRWGRKGDDNNNGGGGSNNNSSSSTSGAGDVNTASVSHG